MNNSQEIYDNTVTVYDETTFSEPRNNFDINKKCGWRMKSLVIINHAEEALKAIPEIYEDNINLRIQYRNFEMTIKKREEAE